MTIDRTLLRGAVLLSFLAACAKDPAPAAPRPPPNDETAKVEERRRPAGALEVEIEPEVKDAKAEAESDKPGYRLEWQRAAWGESNPEFRRHSFQLGRAWGLAKWTAAQRWVNVGPTASRYIQNGSFTGHESDSGRARAILPHPTLPDVVYFLTSGGGLWVTFNWSSSKIKWFPLTDDLPTTGGGSMAFGRIPSTLYLGLGDPYDQILVGGAMVKSTTGGITWSAPVELGDSVSVRDVKVDTGGPKDVVLAGTELGLWRSADGGATYTQAPELLGHAVWSIAKTSAGWLVSGQPCATNGLQFVGSTTLFLSTDRGATWAPISNAGNVFTGNGRTTLGVAQPGDSVVYAYSSTVGDAQMRDVYRSADGGQTWVANGVNSTKLPTNPVAGSMPNMNICRVQCWYNQMILVDPRDPARNTLWIGGDLASAQSKDGGATWTLKTWWLPGQVPSLPYAHADHHAAAFKNTGTPTLILGTDGGLNITSDDGATFSSAKNDELISHLYYTVTGNPELPNLVLGGTQDNGTRLRSSSGSVHDQVSGGDGMGAAYSQDNTNTVIASAQGSSMRTNLSNNPPDKFQNFVAATSGLSDVGFGFFTSVTPAPAGLDPTGRVFFHFSNARVWRTNNGGLSWIRIANAVATAPPISPGLNGSRRFRSSPYNLGVSPTDLNRVAVGAGGGFLDVTTDGGATWTDLNLVALAPGYQGFVTNVTWQDNQNLWVTSVAQAVGSVRVLKGTIANASDPWSSATWTAMQNGLPDLPVTRILFDPRDTTRRTIYAATHVGVYATFDGGASWAPFGAGLPAVRVNDIYMPPDGGVIRIATYGRGIWELPQVEFARATLVDLERCDGDKVLDDGEIGLFSVTLRNAGILPVRSVKVTVSSSNPALTFPWGNTIRIPFLFGRTERTASVKVALSGAADVDVTKLSIQVETEGGLPGGYVVGSTHRVNYDEVQLASATDSVEARSTPWTVSGDPVALPNVDAWQRRSLSPTQQVWWGPDNNGQADGRKADLPDQQVLTSPTFRVGADPLVISFSHRFAFELGAWDGGVVEASADGGATWVDVGGTAYNGLTNAVTSAPIGAGRPAFVNRMVGWPAFAPVSLDLGTAFANSDVKLRFRIGADESTGAPGWEIDDIAISGTTDRPFPSLVPNGTSGSLAAGVTRVD